MTADSAPHEAVTNAILAHAGVQAPLLGGGRMVCVDGPAGAGKTTLAGQILQLATARGIDAQLVHLDDTYQGWEQDLTALGGRLRNYLVGPLASRHTGRYRRFDWPANRFSNWVEVPPTELLVLEGVASGHWQIQSRRATLVWVDADPLLRLERGLARDGKDLRERWLGWQAREAEYFARHDTARQANLRVTTTPPLGSRLTTAPS
ncbi:MAG: uridine kinase family protein [Nocardioides sp.]